MTTRGGGTGGRGPVRSGCRSMFGAATRAGAAWIAAANLNPLPIQHLQTLIDYDAGGLPRFGSGSQ
jgi:hypothetical protein